MELPTVVSLEYDGGTLSVEPVITGAAGPRVPFTHTSSEARLAGDLLLTGKTDPLKMLVDEASQEATTATWVAVLLGFADLTTIQIASSLPSPSDRTHVPLDAPVRQREGAGSGASSSRGQPSSPWGPSLAPIGGWSRHTRAIVSGHRRQLHRGHRASPEALSRALALGIQLREGETWACP